MFLPQPLLWHTHIQRERATVSVKFFVLGRYKHERAHHLLPVLRLHRGKVHGPPAGLLQVKQEVRDEDRRRSGDVVA